MGFSRQEYWSGLPFPSPVAHILSDPPPWPALLGLPCGHGLVFSKWPARSLCCSLHLGYKTKSNTPVQYWFSLSWPTVLTLSPILINFISLSFCIMSGNSFPTYTWNTTFYMCIDICMCFQFHTMLSFYSLNAILLICCETLADNYKLLKRLVKIL